MDHKYHSYSCCRATLLALLSISLTATLTTGLGINWGTQATHPLSPRIVVKMLKDNGIQKVKLFDADKRILNALAGSGIQVMAGIPNDMLYTLANDNVAAQNWVSQNISAHVSSNGDGVDIKYVAVGNEPFLKSFNGSYLSTTLPALQNIQAALNRAGLGNRIKATTPLNADVYQSSDGLPSSGDFRTDIHDLMVSIVTFLSQNGSPFMTNIYPFISLYSAGQNFPFDYAFFNGYNSPLNDNGRIYANMFDANYDTLVWSLQKNGFGNLSIIVGEVGWPTDGDINANAANAQRFNQGFINHVATRRGTPMSGNPIDAYLFSLLDEDGKSIQPGKFERHWGIFNFDGSAKYQLNLGTGNSKGIVSARGVHHLGKKWCVLAPTASLDDPQLDPSLEFACGHADCTSLGYGCSCGGLDARGNVSFAFNSYYQTNNQLDTACRFPNLSVVTTDDPSTDTCKFFTGIEASGSVRISCTSQVRFMIGLLVLTFAVLVYGSEFF